MRRRPVKTLTVLALTGVVAAGTAITANSAPQQDGQGKEIRNVIYLLGDGMGRTHVTAGRDRYYGAAGKLNMERLPYTGAVATYAVEKGSEQPALVTDSASSATAWSSGIKTYNAAIGVDTYEKKVSTLMEEAKSAGFATGNVSTAEITDATPAAQFSHALLRGCQGPVYSDAACLPKKADGTYEPAPQDKTLITPIAEQIARNGTADVILGGGLARFEPDDQKALQAQGYQVLGSFGDPSLTAQTAASQKVATKTDLDMAQGKKVIGLFNRGNLSVEQAKASLPADAPQKQEPTLADMTKKSLSLLNGRSKKGFLLQVEGAQIDKRSHANDAAQTLAEVKAFDDAVKAAYDFAKKDGHTLVVVTADHECAGFNIIEKGTYTNAEAVAPPANTDAGNPANNSTPSRSSSGAKDAARSSGIVNGAGSGDAKNFAPATFRTPDDPKGVQDGSKDASLWLTYLSGNHTGADVPIYAYGPNGSAFAASQNNTELYGKLYRSLFGTAPHHG
ncbi:alkaline phosphatase [Streptomyces sp. NBC_00873]|uniref:alkaline phosphatase n=1 Tax=unclassified Streptomyces TaxID=2593676 RepID=UPI00386ABBFE|nr:alkaline phosphatase [Streptomyces sp. NBC_00873]WSY96761.1 alkaline phosphatase [Streptomyces sp. NBC_00873]WTA41465.1 alkaline phosphatase [Streptomyces sp. NBC_00842]WTA48431.1 alkaline phosphatase [Streptomyces sp. NBC_00842]